MSDKFSNAPREALGVVQGPTGWWVTIGGALLMVADTREAAEQAVGCYLLVLRAGVDTALGIPGVRMAQPDDLAGVQR